MGMIMSIDKQIDNLHFRPFPVKPVSDLRVARAGNVIVAVGKHGTLYTTSHDLQQRVCWAPGRNAFFDDVAVCLRKLGVITPAQVKAHKDWCIQYQSRKDAKCRLESVERNFKAAGLTLTASQRSKLERDAGAKD